MLLKASPTLKLNPAFIAEYHELTAYKTGLVDEETNETYCLFYYQDRKFTGNAQQGVLVIMASGNMHFVDGASLDLLFSYGYL